MSLHISWQLCVFLVVGGVMVNQRLNNCCFSAKHPAWRRKNKGQLAWNQDYMSE